MSSKSTGMDTGTLRVTGKFLFVAWVYRIRDCIPQGVACGRQEGELQGTTTSYPH